MAIKKNIAIALLSFFLLSGIALSSPALADDAASSTSSSVLDSKHSFTLNVPIGGLTECKISASDNNCLGQYISAWYSFALGTVGIIATIMIMIGGFMYLTSGGGGGAKKGMDYIVSAISGLILAFLSYTILNIINPQLLTIHMPSLPAIQDNTGTSANPYSGTNKYAGTAPVSPTGVGGASSGSIKQPLSAQADSLCQGKTSIDYNNTQIPAIKGPDLSQYNSLFDKYDKTDAAMLRSIAAAESGGNANIGKSPAGACGLMQILPATACSFCQSAAKKNQSPAECSNIPSGSIGNCAGMDQATSDKVCNALNDPATAIAIADDYLHGSDAPSFDTAEGRARAFANYNGGSNALQQSNSCPEAGVAKFECCINPYETVNYVANTSGYYNYYSGQ